VPVDLLARVHDLLAEQCIWRVGDAPFSGRHADREIDRIAPDKRPEAIDDRGGE
jgi:hypothetical protein